jgi:hypothetical protein
MDDKGKPTTGVDLVDVKRATLTGLRVSGFHTGIKVRNANDLEMTNHEISGSENHEDNDEDNDGDSWYKKKIVIGIFIAVISGLILLASGIALHHVLVLKSTGKIPSIGLPLFGAGWLMPSSAPFSTHLRTTLCRARISSCVLAGGGCGQSIVALATRLAMMDSKSTWFIIQPPSKLPQSF